MNMDLLKNNYLFEQNEVRIALDENGEPLFCAKDVCKALGIIWKGKQSLPLGKDEKGLFTLYQGTSNGTKETLFIDETRCYRLIFRSDKPNAVKFQDWVCGEVLPQIRKTGGYGQTLFKPSEYLAYSKTISGITEQLASSKTLFEKQMLETQLKSLCNLLGQPMPDVALLNESTEQKELDLNQ